MMCGYSLKNDKVLYFSSWGFGVSDDCVFQGTDAGTLGKAFCACRSSPGNIECSLIGAGDHEHACHTGEHRPDRSASHPRSGHPPSHGRISRWQLSTRKAFIQQLPSRGSVHCDDL